MKRCTQCNTDYEATAKVCPACGNRGWVLAEVVEATRPGSEVRGRYRSDERPKRPVGLLVLCWVYGVSAGMQSLRVMAESPSAAAVVGAILVSVFLVAIFVMLARGRHDAWVAAQCVIGLSLVLAVASFALVPLALNEQGPGDHTAMAIGMAACVSLAVAVQSFVLWYLRRPDVQAYCSGDGRS